MKTDDIPMRHVRNCAGAIALANAILRLPEGRELTFDRYTVCRLDAETWKAHATGTHPDATGEFLDDESEVREWAREVCLDVSFAAQNL